MQKNSCTVKFFTTLSLFLFGSLNAFASSLIIEVPDDPEPTTEIVNYQCEKGSNKESVQVTYHNASNISLADFKWKGKHIIASRSISASGVKYVGGPYIWWVKENEATFSDLIDDPEEKNLISCVEEQGKE
ncbi:MliC family protein [Bartonella raoultii]|uniref:MliC family protein n=1 Tax=Bartonella raoultii TaxID=1457020 RepID=A0ABS7I6C3_9HYPH|nr:MliC family protein [Bartonella raoultii]MBX4335980.1 MliC family protein [Bartonella raoultii]